eukprot:SM000152S01564  [mRNA]  locus=s152:230987:235386:- [translate_table: standard]
MDALGGADLLLGGPVQQPATAAGPAEANAGEPVEQPAKAGTELLAILEALASLDEYGVFANPVDEAQAPNYSKVIRHPMSFAVMRQKARAHQYPTWRSFVEDFERICTNTMKYNAKKSVIWNAGSKLLRQGKKLLEPYHRRGQSIDGIGLADGTGAQLGTCKVQASGGAGVRARAGAAKLAEAKRLVEAAEGFSLWPVSSPRQGLDVNRPFSITTRRARSMALPINNFPCKQARTSFDECEPEDDIGTGAGGKWQRSPGRVAEQPPPEVAVLGVQLTEEDAADLARMQELRRRQQEMDAVEVDLLGDRGPDLSQGVVRPDVETQARDCSSSFGDTWRSSDPPDRPRAELGDEVDSRAHGAAACQDDVAADDEDGTPRSKRPLRQEWKTSRKGIEWRCQWIHLRMKELKLATARYESILRRLQEHKQQLGFCGDLGEQEVTKQLTAQAGTPPLEPGNVKPAGVQQGASAVMTAEPSGRRQVHSPRHCVPAPGAACGQVGELAEASALQKGMAERRQAHEGMQDCARTRGLEVDGWRVLKKSRLMWRQPRLHMEDVLDLDDYMARHPLFSRYGAHDGPGLLPTFPSPSWRAGLPSCRAGDRSF